MQKNNEGCDDPALKHDLSLYTEQTKSPLPPQHVTDREKMIHTKAPTQLSMKGNTKEAENDDISVFSQAALCLMLHTITLCSLSFMQQQQISICVMQCVH